MIVGCSVAWGTGKLCGCGLGVLKVLWLRVLAVLQLQVLKVLWLRVFAYSVAGSAECCGVHPWLILHIAIPVLFVLLCIFANGETWSP